MQPADRLLEALAPSSSTRDRVKATLDAMVADLDDDPELQPHGVLDLMAEQLDGSVTTGELARREGLTVRQLDYWTGSGFLVPLEPWGGSGKARHYPPAQARKAHLMARLVTLFATTPARASELADELLAKGVVEVGGIRITRQGLR